MQLLNDLRNQSNSFADQYGVTGTGVNDARDAFRHAYASAVLARDYGEKLAESAGITAEVLAVSIRGLPSEPESRMDAWNNHVGRTILERLGPNATDAQIAAEVKKALDAGQLVTSPGGVSNSLWKNPVLRYPGSPIDEAKRKFNDTQNANSPIILDLNGDGIQTTGMEDGAYFDHDKNGFAEQTGWVSPEDGLLVRDLDGNGQIDTGRELFGDHTRLADGTDAANGFAALAELDSNQDGQIDAADSGFSTLKIWQDTNGDGLSSADELRTLNDAGVQSITTSYTTDPTTDAQGNEHRQIGTFTTTTGETRAAEDVWFQVDKTYTIATEWLDVPADIAALPDLAGYGNVYGLHQAIEKRWGSDEACNECWANHAERVAA